MRFDRFLNVVYYALLTQTQVANDSKNPEQSRRLLDQELSVRDWRVPGARLARRRRASDEQALPSWWRGDEDASQTFMHAMGIVTVDRGRA